PCSPLRTLCRLLHSLSYRLLFPPLFFLRTRPPPISTLFPYTTLFRSILTSPVVLIKSRPIILQAPEASNPFQSGFETCTFMDRRSEEHTSELQARENLVCRLLLEKKKKKDASEIKRRASTTRDG